MSGTLLTARQSPSQSSEQASLLATGMQIGASAQGLYEKQRFDAAQNELEAKSKMAIEVEKQNAENARAKASNAITAGKELLSKTLDHIKETRGVYTDAIKNTNDRDQAIELSNKVQLLDKSSADIIRDFGTRTGVDTSAIKNVGLVTDPNNTYANTVPGKLFYSAKRGTEQSAIAGGKMKMLELDEATDNFAKTGSVKPGANGKTPAEITTNDYKLQQSAPAAVIGYTLTQKNLKNTYNALWKAGFDTDANGQVHREWNPETKKWEDPQNRYFDISGTLLPQHRANSKDPKVGAYLKQEDAARKAEEDYAGTHSKNVQRVAMKYPEYANFINELNADPNNLANPYSIKDAEQINGKIGQRITELIQSGDMQGATRWSLIKNELGYNAFGKSNEILTPPANGGSATNTNGQ